MKIEKIPFYPTVGFYIAPNGGKTPSPIEPDDFIAFIAEDGSRLMTELGEQVFTPEQEL